jgi:hypothetical protein
MHPTAEATEPDAGQQVKAKVFISYSRKDMGFADRLEAALGGSTARSPRSKAERRKPERTDRRASLHAAFGGRLGSSAA